MYEHQKSPLIPFAHYLQRLAIHSVGAITLLLSSLGIGMLGYSHFEKLSWPDAFLNTAMLLGGMGPVDAPHTLGGKIFAGIYALYAGLVFLIAVGLMFAPIVHRLMHKFHWGEKV